MPSARPLPTVADQAARAIADASFDAAALRPLPPGMRAHLLGILALGYAAGDAQARLGNAPDGAIAWQVQSCLDDYADYEARASFAVAA